MCGQDCICNSSKAEEAGRVDVSSHPEQCNGPALKEPMNDSLGFLPN